jgi:hypothetical protein
MNHSLRFVCSIFLLLLVSRAQSIDIVPSGTPDDADLIQSTLDGLQNGDTLYLTGDFVIGRTIYLPSNFIWILNGSLSLGDDAVLDDIGYTAPGIDATRWTGITEKPGGATTIDMSGGTYYGNSANNSSRNVRFINFTWLTNSRFHDMTITDASDDNFTLGPKCFYNECRNLVGSFADGNALTDKGDYNKWYDCIAEDCASDGWTPKCRNSEFYRCIGRRNAGPGFGCFARLDGSGNPVDLGETIEGNKFYACESYDNERGGFSFNIASTSGTGAIIRNNFVQGKFYNNRMGGVSFRNKQEDGIIVNNEVDILAYGNQGLKEDGTFSSLAGGLATEGSPNDSLTGSVVVYGNGRYDLNTAPASNCSITVFIPDDKNPPVLNKGSNGNEIIDVGFNCSQILSEWCMQVYCSQQPVHIQSVESRGFSVLSQNYPNPFHETTDISYAIPVSCFVSLKLYDSSGRELSTLVHERKQSGRHTIPFNGSHLPQGTYYYRIIAGDYMETRKFVLVK